MIESRMTAELGCIYVVVYSPAMLAVLGIGHMAHNSS
jgi:hypothetical protein